MADLRLLKVGNLVKVGWDDAASHDDGWQEREEIINGVQHCTTVGFVVKRDRKQVVVAMSYGVHPHDGKEHYCTTWAIPTGWITKVEIIL